MKKPFTLQGFYKKNSALQGLKLLALVQKMILVEKAIQSIHFLIVKYL